jgi:hypothetical protein
VLLKGHVEVFFYKRTERGGGGAVEEITCESNVDMKEKGLHSSSLTKTPITTAALGA